MPQGLDPPHSRKHVCVFQLERKGSYFTTDVVCTVCGIKLSSADQSAKADVNSNNRR